MRNRKGFTLAEVLVTLAVIGVVAALTIPALMQGSNEKQAKTSVKKAVSTLNQALTMSIAQDGIDAGSQNASTDLRDLFDNYLSVITNDTNSLTTSDGMIYTFNGDGSNNCTNDASTTTCFVEVDINGNRGSSVAATESNYADIYYFAILKEQVLPANTGMQTVPNFGRGNSGISDNVALEALIN